MKNLRLKWNVISIPAVLRIWIRIKIDADPQHCIPVRISSGYTPLFHRICQCTGIRFQAWLNL